MITEGAAIGRDEWMPVTNSLLLVSQNIGGCDTDEDEHGYKLDEHYRGVKVRRFFNADHKDGGNDGDADERDEIKQGGDVRERMPINMSRIEDGLHRAQWAPIP